MTDLDIRCAALSDIDDVLRFWREAAEGASITDDHDGVARLIMRDPQALLLAERDGRIAGTVIAHHAWGAAGYHREDHWRRWVRSL
ncbi:hypothetical protein ACFYSH_27765 [Streptomyces sp. NPDC005791]|uniref:hypothetical protein n=1 Tax=Streptomyces sp. NPDC005791 TaxID=3364732 RepID=UPI0036994B6F